MFGRRLLRAAGLIGVFAFWAGMVMAAYRYPSEYDWRYMTMSNLVFPDRNIDGHLWASAGIALCGLAGLCWAAALARDGSHEGRRRQRFGISALSLGFFSMALCALLPERLIPIPKTHETLALLAFFSLCVGIMRLTFQSVERYLGRTRCSIGAARAYAALAAAGALSPIPLAGVAQAYVSHARPDLPWVSLAWRGVGVPPYLSFAFWEWVACAVFSAFITTLSLRVDQEN